jgi:hypothetical protein
MKLSTWTLAAALIVAACSHDSRTPVAPSETQPTGTQSSETQSWRFTVQFVSVTGPVNCLVMERTAQLKGTVFSDVPTFIRRSGNSLTISSDLFANFYGFSNIAGTVTGSDFTATGALPSGQWTCQDGTVVRQQAGAARIAGTFSADGSQLTATAVHAYPLELGGEDDYTWTWVGTRQS